VPNRKWEARGPMPPWGSTVKGRRIVMHQGREIIAIGALENGAFCTVFSENFHKF
jgi:hypothetical protein